MTASTARDERFIDKEMAIHIRLRPRRVLKMGISLLILMLVFYLGRLTAGDETGTTTAITAETQLAAPAEEKETAEESWFSDARESVTGLVTGLLPEFLSKEESEETTAGTTAGEAITAATTTTASSAEPAPVANTTTTQSTTAAPENDTVPVAEETVITSYTKVALALNNVVFDWKGTWGKINKVDYTIKNNEAGTVTPSYLIMLVEGYDTEENKIPRKVALPLSAQKLKAAETYNGITNVPQGFAYNQVTAGDLADVRITIQLYDGADKLMASFAKGFDLRGSTS